jgi:hypothetical protein
MHIHDKFVVVDFNGDDPTVFTGSSNLAAGGEQANGDSLAMIKDAAVANMFAIEAVALFDHYHFRKVMQTVTAAEPPLTLWYPGKPNAPNAWWQSYYDLKRIQMRDRLLFAGLPLQPGLAATKNVDWSAIDAAAPKPGGKSKRAPKATSPAEPQSSVPQQAPAKKRPAKKAKGTAKGTGKKTAKKTVAKKAAGKKKKGAAKKRAATKKSASKKSASKKSASKKSVSKNSVSKKKGATKKKGVTKKSGAAKRKAKKRASR